jgi:hypothetical protein
MQCAGNSKTAKILRDPENCLGLKYCNHCAIKELKIGSSRFPLATIHTS